MSPGSPPPPQRRIGVIVNNVGGYSRGVIRGVTSLAFGRGWTCKVEGVNEPDLRHRLDAFDGIIIQAAEAPLARLLAESPRPTVNVSSALGVPDTPAVVTDDLAVGRLGAETFLRRGYRSFAFHAPDARAFALLRHDGFARRLTDAGVPCRLSRDKGQLDAALAAAPRPLAVMGCNDRAALEALEACRAAGLAVPEQVAVLGVDNDELAQSLAFPPLATINTAREQIGFEAAMMLDELMARRAPHPAVRLVPPQGVIARQSIDALAIRDGEIAEAVRYIHANAARRLAVEAVARHVAMSRRQLERRFRGALGRSVHDELLQARIGRARQLLIETDLTLPQVATASGFASASYFSVVVKRVTGHTPAALREQLRPR